jgi:hypothetical protein
LDKGWFIFLLNNFGPILPFKRPVSRQLRRERRVATLRITRCQRQPHRSPESFFSRRQQCFFKLPDQRLIFFMASPHFSRLSFVMSSFLSHFCRRPKCCRLGKDFVGKEMLELSKMSSARRCWRCTDHIRQLLVFLSA